jgi:hypothetical protein
MSLPQTFPQPHSRIHILVFSLLTHLLLPLLPVFCIPNSYPHQGPVIVTPSPLQRLHPCNAAREVCLPCTLLAPTQALPTTGSSSLPWGPCRSQLPSNPLPPFRERDPKYSEKDSQPRERERARRRRRSYSPMRKRRRDSPSHLEARRITR